MANNRDFGDDDELNSASTSLDQIVLKDKIESIAIIESNEKGDSKKYTVCNRFRWEIYKQNRV